MIAAGVGKHSYNVANATDEAQEHGLSVNRDVAHGGSVEPHKHIWSSRVSSFPRLMLYAQMLLVGFPHGLAEVVVTQMQLSRDWSSEENWAAEEYYCRRLMEEACLVEKLNCFVTA